MKLEYDVLLGIPGNKPSIKARFIYSDDSCFLYPEEWVERPQQIKINRDGERVTSISMGDIFGEVADFQPRTLWGDLNGLRFTILDAKMTISLGFKVNQLLPNQVYQARFILWDAHVDGFETEVERIRISLPTTIFGIDSTDKFDTNIGTLSPWKDGSASGLEWTPSTSKTVGYCVRFFPSIITSIYELWTCQKISLNSIVLKFRNSGWCKIHSSEQEFVTQRSDLLATSQLTLAVIGKWLELTEIVGPIPHMALYNSVPLQLDAQFIGTALEGLHRRLHEPHNRFGPHASKGILSRARKAAIDEAAKVLAGTVDSEVVRRIYNESLGHAGDPTYSDRLNELLPKVEKVAPGLFGPSLQGWIRKMRDLRNIQSHGLEKHDNFGESEISEYYVMSISGRWALKISLLLELTTSENLRQILLDSNKFKYSLINMDRENIWENFSIYETFTSK